MTEEKPVDDFKKSAARLQDMMISGLAMVVAASTCLVMVAVPGILLYWGLCWLWAALPWP
jgi:hypothetical protein